MVSNNEKIMEMSMDLAVKVVNLCDKIKIDSDDTILTNQLLRSGVSVGAVIRTINYSANKNEFIAKLQLGVKNCQECEYWIDLLRRTNYLTDEEVKEITSVSGLIGRSLVASINATNNAAKDAKKADATPVS